MEIDYAIAFHIEPVKRSVTVGRTAVVTDIREIAGKSHTSQTPTKGGKYIMNTSVNKRYENLYQACKKYPTIILPNINSNQKGYYLYRSPEVKASGGFIEKFCL